MTASADPHGGFGPGDPQGLLGRPRKAVTVTSLTRNALESVMGPQPLAPCRPRLLPSAPAQGRVPAFGRSAGGGSGHTSSSWTPRVKAWTAGRPDWKDSHFVKLQGFPAMSILPWTEGGVGGSLGPSLPLNSTGWAPSINIGFGFWFKKKKVVVSGRK